jgi:hypothetical protein
VTLVGGDFQDNADAFKAKMEDKCCKDRNHEAKGDGVMPGTGHLSERTAFLRFHKKDITRMKEQ